MNLLDINSCHSGDAGDICRNIFIYLVIYYVMKWSYAADDDSITKVEAVNIVCSGFSNLVELC